MEEVIVVFEITDLQNTELLAQQLFPSTKLCTVALIHTYFYDQVNVPSASQIPNILHAHSMHVVSEYHFK